MTALRTRTPNVGRALRSRGLVCPTARPPTPRPLPEVGDPASALFGRCGGLCEMPRCPNPADAVHERAAGAGLASRLAVCCGDADWLGANPEAATLMGWIVPAGVEAARVPLEWTGGRVLLGDAGEVVPVSAS